MRKILTSLIVWVMLAHASAYSQGFFSGSLQNSTNFFVRDTAIGAAGLPHYDNLKKGSDTWLNLNYSRQSEDVDLELGVRTDMLLNSILRDPNTPLTVVGIGNLFVKVKVKPINLAITAGYFYDQIGSGIVYRSYEERMLGIDNALVGLRLEKTFKDVLRVKAFAGVQKDLVNFSIYKPIIMGLNVDGNFSIGKNKKVTLAPGVGVLNRSMDQTSISQLVTSIEALPDSQRFIPKYNVSAFTVYNTLTVGRFTWYVEGAYKTPDAFYGIRDGKSGQLLNQAGNCVFSTLSYSQKGLGILVSFKRTENFALRTSANERLFRGLLNFLPPITKQHSLRLPSRYFAASLDQHETALGTEINYSPIKQLSISINASYTGDLLFSNKLLNNIYDKKTGTTVQKTNFWYEINPEIRIKPNRSLDFDLGFQYLGYNQTIYRGTTTIADSLMIIAYAPYIDFTHKFKRKMSYRVELQYQHATDFGQWLYGLVEFNVAPHVSLAVSDMWNFVSNPNNEYTNNRSPHHYYSFFAAYTYGAHRFSANYVKQVEGIVCTGGVCRYEPAFSGLKIAITSTF
jgi:Family of unknown function (DUF6029)